MLERSTWVSEIESSGQASILVCITCRGANDTIDAPRAGMTLAEATASAAFESSDIMVRQVRCLGNCSRGPSAAIRAKHSWTYVFGGLDPSHDGHSLIAGARMLLHAADGIMPWRDRPESLKRGLIARVPPLGFLGEKP
jgi:predicted metal-binding protein